MGRLHTRNHDELHVQNVNTYALLWRRLTERIQRNQHQIFGLLPVTFDAAAAVGLRALEGTQYIRQLHDAEQAGSGLGVGLLDADDTDAYG